MKGNKNTFRNDMKVLLLEYYEIMYKLAMLNALKVNMRCFVGKRNKLIKIQIKFNIFFC